MWAGGSTEEPKQPPGLGGHSGGSGQALRGQGAHGRVCRSYRNLATEHEALMQKYLHLLQIVETEKTVAKQLRQQIDDGEIEIERLKAEVKRPGMHRRSRGDPGGRGGSRGQGCHLWGPAADFSDTGLALLPQEGPGIASRGDFPGRSGAGAAGAVPGGLERVPEGVTAQRGSHQQRAPGNGLGSRSLPSGRGENSGCILERRDALSLWDPLSLWDALRSWDALSPWDALGMPSACGMPSDLGMPSVPGIPSAWGMPSALGMPSGCSQPPGCPEDALGLWDALSLWDALGSWDALSPRDALRMP